MALFFSNDLVLDNADSHYPFSQNSNTYYLSGIDQEKTVLLLFPDAPKKEWREVLYVLKTNAHIQVWEGWKYSLDEAREASGVQEVRFLDEFLSNYRGMLGYCDGVYLDFNEHDRNPLRTQTRAHDFAGEIRSDFPGHRILRAYPILRDLRMRKEPEEVEQLRTACDITGKAFRRVLGFVKPGVHEYEIEAEITHEFLRNRAGGHAYTPIIATGKNACVLHYIENKARCEDGQVILFDFGAEYGNYSADLSRSIPVSGRFTPRQRAVYDAVLSVFRQACGILRPGTTLDAYQEEVGHFMTEELIKLELITREEVEKQTKKKPAYKKYFMHGTSHHIGLDTHDVGDRYTEFQAGMIFTVEPGIYIPEENLGIRLENDILIGHDRNVDLMADIPIEADEIEALMNS